MRARLAALTLALLPVFAFSLPPVRLEISPPKPVSQKPLRWDPGDTQLYLVEKLEGGEWTQIDGANLEPTDKHYDRGRNLFVFQIPNDPSVRYRVRARDAIGNTAVVREFAMYPVPVWGEHRGLPDCFWKLGRSAQLAPAVSVFCEGGCSCARVLARLEAARAELVDNAVMSAQQFDSNVGAFRIFIARKSGFQGPKADGSDTTLGLIDHVSKRILLTRDMQAALHELAHAVLLGSGATLYEHPEWDSDPALKELDERFQQRFRDHPP